MEVIKGIEEAGPEMEVYIDAELVPAAEPETDPEAVVGKSPAEPEADPDTDPDAEPGADVGITPADPERDPDADVGKSPADPDTDPDTDVGITPADPEAEPEANEDADSEVVPKRPVEADPETEAEADSVEVGMMIMPPLTTGVEAPAAELWVPLEAPGIRAVEVAEIPRLMPEGSKEAPEDVPNRPGTILTDPEEEEAGVTTGTLTEMVGRLRGKALESADSLALLLVAEAEPVEVVLVGKRSERKPSTPPDDAGAEEEEVTSSDADGMRLEDTDPVAWVAAPDEVAWTDVTWLEEL